MRSVPMTSIHELFEAQVAQTPDAVAVLFSERSLTYSALNERADRVAGRLGALGVGKGSLVGLFVDRSLDMVVGLLGVLKAGAAYLPLDPSLPQRRLSYMLSDARPSAVLTQESLLPNLPQHDAHVLAVDHCLAECIKDPARQPHATSSAGDLAYVIYTSGSTGEPKGVEIEYGAVVNMLTSVQRRPGLTQADTVLAITTLAFDISVLEIFLPLTCGARLVVADVETTRDGEALGRLIEECGATMMQATPATWRMLIEAGWQGSESLKILCGGEAWGAALATQLLPRCASLWNMYGPTETTVWSGVHRVLADQPVVIGRPISNTRFYVLDSASHLVPVGVRGELHISGKGLARGYLNRPELTASRFVNDPFAPEPGARMYRTGDIVQRRPDGTLDYIGRQDNQVKIRGHRIELGEIDANLESLPEIGQCVTLAREDKEGDQRLVAYIVPAGAGGPDDDTLRQALAASLPAYMVPSAFVRLAAFPLTPAGKIDRKALPAPDQRAPVLAQTQVAPRTPEEDILAAIWCDVLDLASVGTNDNFFALGGHSLLAMRVIGEINKRFGAHLSVAAFFQAPTIAGLAVALAQPRRSEPSRPQILTLQSGTLGLPLYFIGARPSEYMLAHHIGEDRPIFAVEAPLPLDWLRADGTADAAAVPSVEELSALYIDALCEHAKDKPCIILGYSLGGKLAFESARALQNAGGHVALVVLIDAWAFTWSGGTRGPLLQSLRWFKRRPLRGATTVAGGPDSLRAWLADARRLLLWLACRIAEAAGERLKRTGGRADSTSRLSGYLDRNGRPIEQSVIDTLAILTGAKWFPRPLVAPGVLFRAHYRREDMLPGYDFTNGWDGLFTKGLKVCDTTGDHVSMVDKGNIGELADRINDVLDEVCAARASAENRTNRSAQDPAPRPRSRAKASLTSAAQ
jgi:amino acid adenylation domain-containing protein